MFSRLTSSRLPSAISTPTIKTTALQRFLSTSHARSNASQSNSFKEGMARYRAFGGPFAKVFLGAVFTYQVIYWTWLKLEMDESKLEKNQQVAMLEKQARELTDTQKK